MYVECEIWRKLPGSSCPPWHRGKEDGPHNAQQPEHNRPHVFSPVCQLDVFSNNHRILSSSFKNISWWLTFGHSSFAPRPSSSPAEMFFNFLPHAVLTWLWSDFSGWLVIFNLDPFSCNCTFFGISKLLLLLLKSTGTVWLDYSSRLIRANVVPHYSL